MSVNAPAPTAAGGSRGAHNIGTLQAAIGVFQTVVGAMMLVTPHRFVSPAYAALQSNLTLWGTFFFLVGTCLLLVAVLKVPRFFEVCMHLLGGSVLVMLAYGSATVGGWMGAVNFGMMGVVTASAPLVAARDRERTSILKHDLFALAAGTCGVLSGIVVLALPGEFSSLAFDAIRSYLPLLGTAFILTGVLLINVQLWATTPRPVYSLAHVLAGTTFIAFLLVYSTSQSAWVRIAYYGGFGATTALLPWLGSRLGRIDPASLRTRLALGLSAAAVIPLLFTVTLMMDHQESVATQQALANQQQLAVALAKQTTSFIGLNRAAVTSLAVEPGLLQLSPDEQRAHLRAFISQWPALFNVSIVDGEGDATASAGDSPLASYTGYPIFEDARRTSLPTWALVVSPVLHRPLLVFASPIRDSVGTFLGAVVGSIEPAELTNFLGSASGRSLAYLVDGHGRVVAHPDASLVQSLANLSNTPAVAALLAGPEKPGALGFVEQRTRMVAGYAQVPNLSWGVVVQQPLSTVLAETHEQRDMALGILLLTAVFAAVAGVAIAGELTGPLRVLGRAVAEVASGVRESQLPESRISEVRQLSRAVEETRMQLAATEADRRRLFDAERTARTEAERQAAQVNALLESLGEAVTIVDRDGNILMRNRAATEITQVGDEDARTLQKAMEARLLMPDGSPLHPGETPQARVLRGESFVDYELIFARPDLAQRRFQFTGSSIRDKSGNVTLGILIFRDVTDLRQLEQMRKEYVSLVSHDLRAPLATLQGYAQMLIKFADRPDKVRSSAETMLVSARRMNAMIQDLVDISRLESGQLKLDLAPVDVASFVVDLQDRLTGALDVTRIRVEISDVLPPILVDPNRLERILTNLLSNALKYSEGEVRVLAAADKERVTISVVDSGPGISAEDVPRLFERFYRASGTRRKDGLGLGLYITKMLVEAHAGRVWVESEPGKGSVFHVAFGTLVPDTGNRGASSPID